MLPRVVYVKLGWALGKSGNLEEIQRITPNPIAGEIIQQEPCNGFIILQGGIPEMGEFPDNHCQ